MAYIYNLIDTWNNAGTTFTAIKMNVTDTNSSASSLLMDLQVGGVSKFNVNKNGVAYVRTINGIGGDFYGVNFAATSAGNAAVATVGSGGTLTFGLRSTGFVGWTNASDDSSTGHDTFITRRGAANLRLGATDAAAPVAQKLSVQSVIAGTTNAAGADWTFTGSQGTGTGAGGSIIFQVAPYGSTGSTQNALQSALTIIPASVAGQSSASLMIKNDGNGPFLFNSINGGITLGPSYGTIGLYVTGGSVSIGGYDIYLARDAASILAQRYSTNAQTYRLYGTYTDASNYERGYMTTDSNGFTIGTEALGTGTKRPVRIIGPSLASAEAVSALELSQTWNTSGTPTALKINITNTASAAGSLLMDLQVGGVRRVGVFANYDTFGGAISILKSGSTVGTILVEQDISSGVLGVRRADNGNSAGVKSSFWEEGTQSAARADVSGFSTGGSRYYAFGASTANDPDTYITRRGIANLRLGSADVGASPSTVTITIATPGVVTWNDHRISTGTPVVFTTTGALPTGITSGTTYYAVVVNANTFQLATSVANAIASTPTVITTSGTQSGTHTGTRYNITQRLSMQGVTGVTDRPGADLFIQGSQGTGTGAGGSIIFQVAPAGSTGSAQNALVNALTINSVGQMIGGPGSASAPTFAFNDTNWGSGLSGMFYAGNGVAFGGAGGTYHLSISNQALTLSSGHPLAWSAGNGTPGSGDTFLRRDDANILAQRNSTAPQTFRLYNTFTDVSNYERGFMRWNSNVLQIGTEKLGTGTNRSIRIVTAGGAYIDVGDSTIAVNGSTGWSDANQIFWQNRSVIASPANGVVKLSNRNETDFDRLQFGGTTSAFPALKRSGAALQVRLADDSGFSPVQGKITTETAYTAGAPTPTGYIVLYDSNGTAYKVPAQLL